VAFSPDGQYLAAAGLNGKVYIWESQALTPDAKPLHTLTGHEDAIYQLAFSPDSQRLFSASRDHTVRRWHLDKLPDTVLSRSTVTSSETFPFLSSTGRYLFWNDGGGTIHLLDLTLPDPIIRPVVLHGAPLNLDSLTLMSDDEHWLAALGDKGSPYLWDVTRPSAPPIVLAAPSTLPSDLSLTADGRWLIGRDDQSVYLWNATQPTAQPIDLAASGEYSLAHAVSPDGRWLATVGAHSGFRLWDLAAPDPAAAPLTIPNGTAPGALAPSYVHNRLGFSSDGRYLIAMMEEPPKEQPALWAWDLRQLPHVSTPQILSFKAGEHLGRFTLQGHWLLALSDEAAYAWDLTASDFAAKPPRKIVTGADNSGLSIAMSPDERWLAVGGSDDSTRLWAMSNLSSTPQVLLGQNVIVSNLAFSPDSQWLATSGPIGGGGGGYYELPKRFVGSTVLLWNLAQSQLAPVVLHGGAEVMTASGFSPDGQWLITPSNRGTQLWDMSLDRLSTAACEVAGRNFTRLEWSQYFPDQPYRKTCDQWPLEDSNQ
jgi:WD40 repeat protein